jgi:carnitine O-acetyltransferase
VLTYPHHLTTDLPELPVPSLQESMERFRIASAAVYGAAGEADVNQAIADFVMGPAPALQETLEEYAAAMAAQGISWAAEHQLERALTNRQPLQLTTNATFQLDVPTTTTGTDRVVELLQRLGAIHLQQARRDIEPEVDAHGGRVSMDPWASVNGGIRSPEAGQDVWVRAGTGATYRTVGLIYFGRMWEVPLTGSEGKLLNADQLRASVEYVLSQTEPPEQNFVSISALGSAVLAVDPQWEQPKNRAVYTRLTNMLFTLTLDPHAEDPDEALQRWAFLPGYAWVYKPMSYIAGLNSGILAAHVEQSVMHAGTLATAVARMQQVDVNQLETQQDTQVGRAEELTWQDSTYDLSGYIQRAIGVGTQRVVVRRDEHIPFAISEDLRAQLVLMLAQQLTYGQIRAHAQCCDMRHYRAGRSETIRPVTLEAVRFVQNLVQDQATEAQFTAALESHRGWIQATKAGKAFDSHLDMLQHIGRELGGANAELFTEHNAARQGFLATVTTDNTDALIRAVVPPSAQDGFGVHYTAVPEGTEFVVTWDDHTPQAEDFVHYLSAAAELLYDFIAGLAPIT